MLYFKAKQKNVRIDFGKGRVVGLPMFNILEVDDEKRMARVKSYTGEVMIYCGNGDIAINNIAIAKLLIDKRLESIPPFKYKKIK